MISIDIPGQRVHAKRPPIPRGKKKSVEQVLWSGLRGKRLHRFKFRRRFSFGVFILDFYCQKSRLAVEIVRDDQIRNRQDEYAHRRRQYIELYEIAVMQFAASEISNNIDAVLAKIAEVARKRSGAHPVPHYQLHPIQSSSQDQMPIPLG